MTAQVPESLIYKGDELSMCAEPLEDYFALTGLKPPFEMSSSALWRRYVGTWEVIQDRLYLVGISGTLESGEDAKLATIFPDFPERVFANWYSGTIRAPEGKLLEYIHMGYASLYERDRYFEIEKGVVLRSWVEENGASNDEEKTEGYEVHAFTTFARPPEDGGDRS